MGVNELVSPAFTQPLYSAQLTFRNNYDLETDTQFLTNGFDGGVLELKVGTGAFVDILAAGGSFVAGGYTKTLDTRFSNPLAGRRAWSGVSGGYTNVIVNLPSTNAGQTVQLRWRCGSDDSTGRPGWRIDSVSVTGRACCTNSPPVIATQSNLYNVIETTLLTVTNMLIDPGLPANPVVFSLLSPPTGASIDTNTGVITWIPSEGQGPGTNLITTIARNSAVPGLAATNTFTVIILESNLPPILPNQTNRTLFGLQSLTVTNTATDADLPANPLNYILQTGPTNAAIDANGIISWTPLISQVPSTNLFTTVVTDTDPSAVNATSLSATNSFTVVVNAIHNGPSLPVRTNRTVVELTTMTVNNSATDNDVPPRALNYALISPPAGASISSNGVVTWTPDESQGPGTNIIMTVVTDDGTPPLSATNSFTVNVLESNTPPVLPVQSNRTLTGLQTLSVTNAATDSDLPANPLTYTLQTGPSNAVIDANGIISWTPVVSQVPSTNLFTTVVTDTNPPAINETSFSSTNSFFVIVNAIHNGPQLPLQTNHSVLELTTLCVTNTATVNDVPPRALTYTLANPPAGALISTNGVITWQPTESQGPGTNIITTIVTDDGSPPLSATNNFTLIVLESNSPPVLPVQTNYILVGMQTLVVTNSGTDSDIPANALTYILQSGPSNAEMDASGVITWTPDLSQVPSTNLFTTVVTDSNPAAVNATSLSATNSFYVTVNLPDQTPRTILIQTITLSHNIATITWTSVSGNTYRLQYKTNWDDASWTDFSPDVPATGATTSAQDDISAQTQRLYRVMLVP